MRRGAREGEPLETAYFKWLTKGLRVHRSILHALYSETFLSLVNYDDNRALDGVRLREEFLEEALPYWSRGEILEWIEAPACILEVLLALANRAAFNDNGSPQRILEEMIGNIDFGYTDLDMAEAIERFNNRTYGPDGRGGVFPLKHPVEDQRFVELWYQMAAYFIENSYGEEE